MMERKRNTGNDPEIEKNSDNSKEYSIILHNDDVHDFNFVIDSLIEICGHDDVQAEQCAYIVHYNGECDIKTGKYKNLKPMHEELYEKGLEVTLTEQVCH